MAGEILGDEEHAEPLLVDEDQGGEQPEHKNGRVWRPIVAAFFAATGALCFGYALGFSSPAEPAMLGSLFDDVKCGDDDDQPSVASPTSSLWSSVINVGAMVGALAGSSALESAGRRGTLLFFAAPALGVGWAATATLSGNNIVELLGPRILVGVGVGLCSSAVPVYIAETSPASLRGALGNVNQLSVTFGIFLVYLVGFMLPHSRRTYDCGATAKSIHPSGWVVLAWIGCGLAGALAVAALLIPETPSWLRGKGKTQAANRASGALGESGDDVLASRQQQEQQQGTDEQHSRTARDIVSMLLPRYGGGNNNNNGKNDETVDFACRAPVRIAFTLMLVQQFSGINAVIFYAGSILGSAGMSNRDLGGLIVMTIQVVVTGLGSLFVDRLGRRPLLLGSLAGMTAAAALMATYFLLGHDAPSFVALVALVVYIASFSMGLGPLPWALMAEILPFRARGSASAVVTCVNWLCSFVVTETYDYVELAVTPAGTFALFSAVCLVGFLYVSAVLPETKGKTLAEIETYFETRTARSLTPPPPS